MTENTHHRDEDQGPAGGRPPAPEDFSLPADFSDEDLFDTVPEDTIPEASAAQNPSSSEDATAPVPSPAAETASTGADQPADESEPQSPEPVEPVEPAEAEEPAAAEAALPAEEDLDESEDDDVVVEDEEPEEIVAPTDIGTNAQQVVTALLGHQQDLVAELRSVYNRLEEVREVDYAALQERVTAAESTVAATPTTAELEQLVNLLEEISGSLKDQETKQAELEAQLKEATEQRAAQLAERDARISAQNARIEELESAITAAAESADSAHERLEALAQETGSSVIHRVQDRVSPAAQQAKNALNNIRRRFKR